MRDAPDMENELAVIEVSGSGEHLAKALLDEKIVAYQDNLYEVTSGGHEILLRLIHENNNQNNDKYLVYYLHVPYAYPIPEGVQLSVKKSLQEFLDRSVLNIEFINAGAETRKSDLRYRLELGDE